MPVCPVAEHPAPAALHTPTDLSPEQARKIVEAINPLIARIDPLAERVRKLDGTTLRGISQISGTTVQGDNDDFVTPQELLKRVMQDNQTLAHNQRAAHEVCDDNGDPPPPACQRSSSTRPSDALGSSSKPCAKTIRPDV